VETRIKGELTTPVFTATRNNLSYSQGNFFSTRLACGRSFGLWKTCLIAEVINRRSAVLNLTITGMVENLCRIEESALRNIFIDLSGFVTRHEALA